MTTLVVRTPPLHCFGLYGLRMPLVADPTVTYSCMAIRTFNDIEKLGIDVFKTYFEPMGLVESDYTDSKNVNANIITLMSDAGVIYVPDTFIETFPSMTQYTYNVAVLSVSLGAVPDYLDTSFLQQQLAGVCSDVIGVVPTVNLHIGASTGSITPDQHQINEAARLAAIKIRVTDRAKYLAAQSTITDLQAKITAMTTVLKAHNLLT